MKNKAFCIQNIAINNLFDIYFVLHLFIAEHHFGLWGQKNWVNYWISLSGMGKNENGQKEKNQIG